MVRIFNTEECKKINFEMPNKISLSLQNLLLVALGEWENGTKDSTTVHISTDILKEILPPSIPTNIESLEMLDLDIELVSDYKFLNDLDGLVDEASKLTFKKYSEHGYMLFHPISSIVYNEGLSITLSDKLLDFYHQHKANSCTIVDYEALKSLKSIHAESLFTLLSQEKAKSKNNTEVNSEISLSELKHRLRIDNTRYERYPDFKKRVLAPAIESINTLGYNVQVEEIKDGRKVTGLKFNFNEGDTNEPY